MYYRISCIIHTGEIRGYQWRELDLDTFCAIAQGQRPLGDSEAQSRDSTEIDPTFSNSTVYYGHVWHNGWVTEISREQAVELYELAAHAQPGV